MNLKKRLTLAALLCLASTAALCAANPADAELINVCAARTDARMESMTSGKLQQIRNYEFSLRIAIAQLAGGERSMAAPDWRRANDNLSKARQQFAKVCEVALPRQMSDKG